MASHLSHSQLDLFIRCPRQWYETYYGEIKGGVSESLILGDAFHKTLEQDGELRRRFKTPLSEKNLLREFLRQHLPASLERMDPEKTLAHDRIRDIEQKGEAMLRAYSHSIAPMYHPVVVEKPFNIHIPFDINEPLLDIDGDPWTVVGYIDALTINADGDLVVVDWKTAAKAWKPGAENSKDQATMYIMACMLAGLGLPKQVTFITFPAIFNDETQRYECGSYPFNEDGEVVGDFRWHADVRVTKRDITDVYHMIDSLRRSAQEINAIRRGELTPVAKPHGLCPYCPMRDRCLPGLRWMKQRNKKLPEHSFTKAQIDGEEDETAPEEIGEQTA